MTLQKLKTVQTVTLQGFINPNGYTDEAIEHSLSAYMQLYGATFLVCGVAHGNYEVTVAIEDYQLALVAFEKFEEAWLKRL